MIFPCNHVELNNNPRYQAITFVRRPDAAVRESSVTLTCSGGKFTVTGTSEQFSVESATCNKKQEPRLVRSQEQCAPIGTDGRTDNLESLWRVAIGWQVGERFIEQIGLCVDESNYGTLWTNHTLHGASIAFRDIDPKRPSFRVDTSAYTRTKQRWFPKELLLVSFPIGSSSGPQAPR